MTRASFLLDPLAACFTEAALQVGDNALKRVHIGAGAKHILALHLDFFSSGAIQDDKSIRESAIKASGWGYAEGGIFDTY